MNIIELNTCTYGSTGKIMRQISDIAINNGHKCWLAVPLGRHNTKKNNPYSNMLWIGNRISEDSHIILGRVLGLQGYGSILATFFFLRKLDKIGVDVLHIHNLHNSYINIPMLLCYSKHGSYCMWNSCCYV